MNADQVNELMGKVDHRVKSDLKEKCGYCKKDLASDDLVNSDVIGFFST